MWGEWTMSSILAVDVGGTSIKFGRWHNNQLSKFDQQPTPDTLNGYYQLLESILNNLGKVDDVKGVAMSLPGAVNKVTGVIEGSSAIPYIHNFPIKAALESRLGTKVTIENDANCAGLAENQLGAGKDVPTILMLVIGSGVGGAIINNGLVWHGRHLFGGEFGNMIIDPQTGQTLSNAASPVNVAREYSKKHGHQVTGKELFDLAMEDNHNAQMAVSGIITALAQASYNLQNAFDPDKIILGGAVSANPHLLPWVNKKIKELSSRVDVPGQYPQVEVAQFHNEANQLGALIDFCQTYQLDMQKI